MGIIEQDRDRYRNIFGERDKQKDYWVYSLCSLCYNECAIRVRVLDGKPIAIEGVPESDRGAQGGLCAKGVTSLMDFYNPNRILYPVKRTNPKKGLYEDPKWQRISWEEALDIITEKLLEAREKDPRSVGFSLTPGPTGGMRANVPYLEFMPVFGTNSNLNGGPGVMCGASAHHIGALQYAAWDIIPDYRFCNYVLRCGGNEGWGGGRNASTSIRMLATARERGMKMKVMDPQGFTVASKGDEWIPILPATDLAVFLAISNLIVNEIGVYDKEYIRHKTNGAYLTGPNRLFVRDEQTQKPLLFDEADVKVKTYDDPTLTRPAIEGEYTACGVECQPVFALIKEHLKQYQPDWASEISTVPADTIQKLAEELVEEAKIGSFIDIDGVKVPYRPACVVGYRGLQTHQNSFHQYTAMHLINILLGNQDACGGLLGSGTARSLGYPETGNFQFTPYGGIDGMLTTGAWPIPWASPWPPPQIAGPGTVINFSDIFPHSGVNFYPYAEDWEELWTNVGRPFELAVFFTYGGNVVMNILRPEAVEKVLRKIPFSFALQPFHNETTEGFCDIVLPETHYLEALDVSSSFGVTYNYPIGLEKWDLHLRMPVTEPRGETRDIQDVMNDLADRVGIRPEYNIRLDDFYTFRNARKAEANVEIPRIIESGDTISNIELVDRTLKHHFGKERSLEWFRDHGFMNWNKRPEECYWRWFVNARIPIYYECIEGDKDETRNRAEKAGFRVNWDYLTGMTSYFPSVIHTELPADSEYDLFVISQRDTLMTYRFTAGNPYLNKMATLNPFTYNIAMHVETAREKGIKDGDTICLENHWGDKVTGRVKLTQLIHPKVVAAVGLGSWAKGRPIARGKGINPNALLRGDQYHFCTLSGSSEATSRVKAYTNYI